MPGKTAIFIMFRISIPSNITAPIPHFSLDSASGWVYNALIVIDQTQTRKVKAMTSRTDFALFKKSIADVKKVLPIGESFQQTVPRSFINNPQKFLALANAAGMYETHIHAMPNGGTSPAGHPIGGVITFEYRGSLN